MFVFSVEFPSIHRNGLYRKHGTLFLVVFFFFTLLYFILLLFCTLLSLGFCFMRKKNKKDVWTAYFDSQEKFVTQLNLKNNDDDDNN